MKNLVVLAAMSVLVFTSCKQEVKDTETTTTTIVENVKEAAMVKTVALTQTDGEFMQKELVLDAGTYVFEIGNKNVDHPVGFVLAPKGKTDEANHIKSAYVKAPVKTGSTSMTNEVVLAKGEYVYFCPLNPTPQYSLTVK